MKKEAEMNNKTKLFCKWLAYLVFIVAMTAIGGDFGLVMAIALVFLIH